MATLETQYKLFLEQNPDKYYWSYTDWLRWHSQWLADSIKNIDPTISDDFQIGPDGAYEATEEFELYQKYRDEFAGYEDVPGYDWFAYTVEAFEDEPAGTEVTYELTAADQALIYAQIKKHHIAMIEDFHA